MNTEPYSKPLTFVERVLWSPVLVVVMLWFTFEGVIEFVFCRRRWLLIGLITAVRFAKQEGTAQPPTKGPAA